MNFVLRRLWSVAAPEKTWLAWGFVFLILSSGASLVYPQVIRWMVDNVLQPKRLDDLAPIVLGLFAIFVIQGLAGSLRYYLFTLSGERMVLRLRRILYEKILGQETAFFDFQRTGDLMSRLASDCTTLQSTVSVNVSMALRNVGQVVGGLGFMFYTSWRLSALMLILIPPVAIAAAIFGKRIRHFSKDFQKALAEASIVADETISSIKTVKSFVQEQTEVNRYELAMRDALAAAKRRTLAIAIFMTFAMIAGFGAISFVLWFGGRQVVMDQLSTGDLTQFLLYLMLVAIGVGSLGSLWGDIMSGVGASQRVFEIMERTSEEVATGEKLTHVAGHIEFKDVHFRYPARSDVEVLRGISLAIRPGQVVALVDRKSVV